MTEPNEASYQTRTPKPDFRAGIVLGAALLVLVGVGAAMGASPSTSTGADADATQQPAASASPSASEAADHQGRGWHGVFGRGPFGFGGKFGLDGTLPGRGFGAITITAIDGSNLSLATADGWHRTVTVTSDTTITKAGATIGVGDLAVGDTVRFAQRRNADGSYTITRIDVVVPQRAGTVTGVTDDGFTLQGNDGTTTTITVTDQTTYTEGGSSASRADVVEGSTVVVSGTASTDTFTAQNVTILLPKVVGEVTAKTESTITIRRLDGTTATLNVGSGTMFVGPDSASLDDVTVGSIIAAEVRQQDNDTFDAVRIHVGNGVGRGPKFPGWPDNRPGLEPDTTPAPSAGGSSTG